MNKKDALVMKLEAQLDEWSADLKKLKAKAKHHDANAKLEQEKQIKQLQTMEETARQKLKELKRAGEDALDDLEDKTRKYWVSLGREIKAYESRI